MPVYNGWHGVKDLRRLIDRVVDGFFYDLDNPESLATLLSNNQIAVNKLMNDLDISFKDFGSIYGDDLKNAMSKSMYSTISLNNSRANSNRGIMSRDEIVDNIIDSTDGLDESHKEMITDILDKYIAFKDEPYNYFIDKVFTPEVQNLENVVFTNEIEPQVRVGGEPLLENDLRNIRDIASNEASSIKDRLAESEIDVDDVELASLIYQVKLAEAEYDALYQSLEVYDFNDRLGLNRLKELKPDDLFNADKVLEDTDTAVIKRQYRG